MADNQLLLDLSFYQLFNFRVATTPAWSDGQRPDNVRSFWEFPTSSISFTLKSPGTILNLIFHLMKKLGLANFQLGNK